MDSVCHGSRVSHRGGGWAGLRAARAVAALGMSSLCFVRASFFAGALVALACVSACNKSEEKPAGAAPAAGGAGLSDPSKLNETAPATYKAKFTTTQGEFVIEVQRDLAPNGADRFYNLVKNGFYDDTAFFRVVDGFMVQFGISGTPSLNNTWRGARIPDDPVKEKNTRGMVTFATSGPNSRTTQVFINFVDNVNLDAMGFAPFGKVVSGMEVVDKLFKGYGEGAPRGAGPNQMLIQTRGNEYLKSDFPKLDYTQKATIEH
jgi:peptidyl-prolyl cis-trans isomerase A (cyclophilin A)